jgi:orotate phosphoribosyltransferase
MLPARKGHFRFESGHHSDQWLDLEELFARPEKIYPFAQELASKIAVHRPDGICGPLVEGAFLAMVVSSALQIPFFYAERIGPGGQGLFPYGYRLPGAQRARARGRRIAIVNDVISAGSAVRGTLADLTACGATTVAIGCLLTMGLGAQQLAASAGAALETLAAQPLTIWAPSECPLCARGTPLSGGFEPAPSVGADG